MCSPNSDEGRSDEPSETTLRVAGGLSDEELAAALRSQTTSVSELGDELADAIERDGLESDGAGGILTELVELSNLLVQIAETVDRTHE